MSSNDDENVSRDDSAPQETEDEKKPAKKKKKLRLWIWIPLGIFILLAVGGYSFYEYSNTPQFCESCHIMEPYIEAWKSSEHSEFGCIECHIAPSAGAKWEAKVDGMLQAIKYLTRSYASKPYAEIEDESCMRSGCHDERLVQEHSTETFKNNVVFDHMPHEMSERRGKQLRCTSCHAQIVVGNHMEVTTSTCYLCHFRESDKHDVEVLSDCRLCHKDLPDYDVEHDVIDPHNPDIVLDTVSFNHMDYADRNVACASCHSDVVQGEGSARQDRCLVCHNDPDHLARFDDTEFIHDNHITEHNVTCERCHDPIKHQNQAVRVDMRGECSSCHVSFHNGQNQMYMGIGSSVIDEKMPSSMYSSMVACTGCHMVEGDMSSIQQQFLGFTKVVNYDACAECHADAPDFYVEMFKDSMDTVRTQLEEVQALRDGIDESAFSEAELEKIDHDLNFVNHSLGWAHNSYYASTILDEIEDRLNAK